MLIGGDVVGKKFESNETAETGVLGLINHSHSAATELFDHPVMRDGLANHARVGNPWRQSQGGKGRKSTRRLQAVARVGTVELASGRSRTGGPILLTGSLI